MPPTLLLILLALLSAALSPLVLAGLLIALLSPRWRRPAGRVLGLALLAGGLVDALCRLAGLGGEGWTGFVDGPFAAACAVFTAWCFTPACCCRSGGGKPGRPYAAEPVPPAVPVGLARMGLCLRLTNA